MLLKQARAEVQTARSQIEALQVVPEQTPVPAKVHHSESPDRLNFDHNHWHTTSTTRQHQSEDIAARAPPATFKDQYVAPVNELAVSPTTEPNTVRQPVEEQHHLADSTHTELNFAPYSHATSPAKHAPHSVNPTYYYGEELE